MLHQFGYVPGTYDRQVCTLLENIGFYGYPTRFVYAAQLTVLIHSYSET